MNKSKIHHYIKYLTIQSFLFAVFIDFMCIFIFSFTNYTASFSMSAQPGEAGGTVALPKNKKLNVFGQKIDAVGAKINHTNFICT